MVSVNPEWYAIAMSTDSDPDLHLRGRSDAASGSFARCCRALSWNGNVLVGGPTAIARTARILHTQHQISVLVDGQVKTFNVPAALLKQVRQKIELRRRFEAAATAICNINLRRYLKTKGKTLTLR